MRRSGGLSTKASGLQRGCAGLCTDAEAGYGIPMACRLEHLTAYKHRPKLLSILYIPSVMDIAFPCVIQQCFVC